MQWKFHVECVWGKISSTEAYRAVHLLSWTHCCWESLETRERGVSAGNKWSEGGRGGREGTGVRELDAGVGLGTGSAGLLGLFPLRLMLIDDALLKTRGGDLRNRLLPCTETEPTNWMDRNKSGGEWDKTMWLRIRCTDMQWNTFYLYTEIIVYQLSISRNHLAILKKIH